MAIDFSNAKVLSYQHKHEFFNNNFNYRVAKQFSIQGSFYNLPTTSGISGTWYQLSQMVKSATDYDPITINGILFGSGKVTNLNFSAGNDVQTKEYSADIQCWHTGDLFNLTGSHYSGIDTFNFKLVENLQETFSYNQQLPKNVYTHDVSMRLNSGAGIDPITLSKTLAASLFNANNLAGFIGIYTGSTRKTYVESYNLISNECSFSEKMDYDQLSGVYSTSYTDSIQTSENGITTVTENGRIKGEARPISGAIYSGLATEILNAFIRCSGVFSVYAPAGAEPIKQNVQSKQVNVDTFNGVASYSVLFTNDLRVRTSASWEFTQRLDKSDLNIFTVTEQGNIVGYGRRRIEKITNATSQFNAISGTIGERATGFYTGNTYINLPLNVINQTYGRSEVDGRIEYSQSWTDDTSLINSSGIRKAEIQYTDDAPTNLVAHFDIFNVKEIIQPISGVPTISHRRLSMNLIGSRAMGFTGYIDQGKRRAAPYVPTSLGDDVYLSECSFNWSSGQNSCSANFEWMAHSGGTNFNDISIINV